MPYLWLIWGLNWGGLSSVERVVSEMSLGRKTACAGAPKVPRACNCVGSTLLRRSLFM